VDVERFSYLEIHDRTTRQPITVVDLLCPSSKQAGGYRDTYLLKRGAFLARELHLVEIDLLRGGPRLPWVGMPSCDYFALVSRAGQRPYANFWPIQLRDRLPIIPIPLREGDADARLDLQQLLHRIYDSASYELWIYRGLPHPPLSPEDAAWASQFVPRPGGTA
jgi:hypothetical protein